MCTWIFLVNFILNIPTQSLSLLITLYPVIKHLKEWPFIMHRHLVHLTVSWLSLFEWLFCVITCWEKRFRLVIFLLFYYPLIMRNMPRTLEGMYRKEKLYSWKSVDWIVPIFFVDSDVIFFLRILIIREVDKIQRRIILNYWMRILYDNNQQITYILNSLWRLVSHPVNYTRVQFLFSS